MNYYIFDLICRQCGKKLKRRMSQFDSLPNCPECEEEMLVENAHEVESDVE